MGRSRGFALGIILVILGLFAILGSGWWAVKHTPSELTQATGQTASTTTLTEVEHSNTSMDPECMRAYANDQFGFSFNYPVCNPDQYGYVLTPVESEFGPPWLLSLDFCTESVETGQGSCGMGNVLPELAVIEYSGQDLSQDNFRDAADGPAVVPEDATKVSSEPVSINGYSGAVTTWSWPMTYGSNTESRYRQASIKFGDKVLVFGSFEYDAQESALFDTILSTVAFGLKR